MIARGLAAGTLLLLQQTCIQMIRTVTLLSAATLALGAMAQSWTVGQPVDMLLYAQPFYGGCSPAPDYTFTMPMSTVSGVDYKVVITEVVPANGSVSIYPGLANGVLNSELVLDATVERSVTLAPGTTSATLQFKAQGTPTQPGQVHPCNGSAFWMSNLMFCPEGLMPNIDDGCVVQDMTTHVGGTTSGVPLVQYPSAANGQRLIIDRQSATTASFRILDGVGRVVRSGSVGQQTVVELSALPHGIYTLDLQTGGALVAERFVIEGN